MSFTSEISTHGNYISFKSQNKRNKNKKMAEKAFKQLYYKNNNSCSSNKIFS